MSNHISNGEFYVKKKDKSDTSSFKLFKTILFKDLKSEVRQIHDLISILLFDIISIFIFSSAYNVSTQEQNMTSEIFVIEIWVIIFFTLIFLMAKLFIKEKESGTLNGILSAPVSPNIIFMSKILFGFLLLSLIEVVLMLFGFLLSNPSGIILNVPIWLFFLVAILLPTLDLCITGTLVSAFSMYAKNKSFILPVLLFPILLPIASPIISMNVKLLQGLFFADILMEFFFLIFHVILMFSILILVSDILLTE